MADTWQTGTPPGPGLYRRLMECGTPYAVWNGRKWHSYVGKSCNAEKEALLDSISEYQDPNIKWQKAGEQNE